jgi:benzoyl-CoA reductase/2-hydroxyglutaryl-CoA dehydratase subunit BcrC/BadD/HgdB
MTGKEISSQRLREAVELHNQNRRLLRQLNQLRKENPPLISGVEMSRTVIANMSLPVEEGNELLRNVLTEKTTSPVASAVARARVFIYGSELDDVAFLQLVEENGAWVVMDDIGVGTRFYWHDVEITPDPLEGLAERYLLKIKCPRTYWRGKPEERFRYIWDYVRDFAVQGAILYSYRFCDAHALDIPELKDYLRSQGLPAIPVESDYNLSSIAALKTRVQAFIEMLGQSGF